MQLEVMLGLSQQHHLPSLSAKRPFKLKPINPDLKVSIKRIKSKVIRNLMSIKTYIAKRK
jgi:hypothetical protein